MGTIIGTVYFLNSSENQGTVETAYFGGSSINNGETLINTYFYDTSINGISGNVVQATFYNNSTNTGTITGAANFTGSANNSGILTGEVFFADTSINNGTISSTSPVVFSESATNTGIISATMPVLFEGNATNSGTAYEVQFQGSAINVGAILVSAVFTENTINSGSVVTSIFREESTNTGIIISSATFTGNSTNTGNVSGDAVFLDTTTNTGIVSGNAAFTGDASNLGVIKGNAEFQVDVLTDDDPDPEFDFIQLDDELDFLLVSDGDISTGIVSGESIALTSVQLLSAAAYNNIIINGVTVRVGTYDLYNVAGSVVAINIIYYPTNTELYNDNIYSYRATGNGGYTMLPTTRKKWETSIGDVFTVPTATSLANNIGYTNSSLTILLVNSVFTYNGIVYQTDAGGLITPNI